MEKMVRIAGSHRYCSVVLLSYMYDYVCIYKVFLYNWLCFGYMNWRYLASTNGIARNLISSGAGSSQKCLQRVVAAEHPHVYSLINRKGFMEDII